jgi:subtilisin family serine protease
MSEREYIVTLNVGVDYAAFNAEMIEETGAGDIPNRTVEVTNARLVSQRNTHYALTDEEAAILTQDSRVAGVEIPPDQRDDLEIGFDAVQTGDFTKTSSDSGVYLNWGMRRCATTTNDYNTGNTVSGDYEYNLDGSGVDVVIHDSGLHVDHPEFMIAGAIDSEYNNGAIIDVTGDGSDFFKREVTTNGVRIVAAGTVGGQTAVPDAWLEKVARMFELFTDPNGAGISEVSQRNLIKTLSGDAGTYHASAGPTLQRVARGAGSDYTPNFLTDEGIASWNLTPLFDAHVANDMVWYLNSTGDGYGIGEIDAQEVIEHVFHTLHMHGLDAVSLKMYLYISADWATGPLYNAMVEAYDDSFWDPAGYGGDAFKTDGDAFEVAAKEYLYLLNFCMFEYTGLWDGDSLAPEWADTVRTAAQIQTNLPLGYALFNTYIAPVISKPSLATINSIFGDGNTPAQDNPALAGTSGYVVSTAGTSRVQQIDWYTESGVSGTQNANHYRDNHGHGTHVAGTVAGKTYGWAKNARIYSIKVSGLEGTGDSGTGIPITDCFDVIKGWHDNKPIDPVTGYKRPTIVNMSWGYGSTNSFEPYDGYYRGTQWTYDNNNAGVAINLASGTDMQKRTGLPLWNSYSSGQLVRKLNTRITSVDNDVQELIDAGIHVCIASGNRNLTIDMSGGPDYDNSYRVNPYGSPGGYIYYCRGSSPFSTDAFMVGNADSATNSNDDLEQRSSTSNHGPGVDIYAPGTNIMSSCSNTNAIGGQDYNIDSSYKQANISGTSMASPQVCGVGALALQVNPHMTPAQLKTFLHNQSQSGKLREEANYANWTIADSDYSSSSTSRYLAGAPDRFLYSPYPGQFKFKITNS